MTKNKKAQVKKGPIDKFISFLGNRKKVVIILLFILLVFLAPIKIFLSGGLDAVLTYSIFLVIFIVYSYAKYDIE